MPFLFIQSDIFKSIWWISPKHFFLKLALFTTFQQSRKWLAIAIIYCLCYPGSYFKYHTQKRTGRSSSSGSSKSKCFSINAFFRSLQSILCLCFPLAATFPQIQSVLLIYERDDSFVPQVVQFIFLWLHPNYCNMSFWQLHKPFSCQSQILVYVLRFSLQRHFQRRYLHVSSWKFLSLEKAAYYINWVCWLAFSFQIGCRIFLWFFVGPFWRKSGHI